MLLTDLEEGTVCYYNSMFGIQVVRYEGIDGYNTFACRKFTILDECVDYPYIAHEPGTEIFIPETGKYLFISMLEPWPGNTSSNCEEINKIDKCRCNIRDLMMNGCKCGGI